MIETFGSGAARPRFAAPLPVAERAAASLGERRPVPTLQTPSDVFGVLGGLARLLGVKLQLDDVRQRRHAEDAHAAGVVDGVEDRRMRRRQRRFADARRAERSERPRRFEIEDLHVVRDVLRIGDAAIAQRGVQLQIVEVLGQGEADALREAAVDLAVDRGAVDDRADVDRGGELDHLGLAGLHVDFDFRHEDFVHVDRERSLPCPVSELHAVQAAATHLPS